MKRTTNYGNGFYNSIFYILQMEELLLRRDRYKSLKESNKFPQSTSQRLIIPCFQRSYGFKLNQFCKRKEMHEEYVDRETVENFIKEANDIFNKELILKNKMEILPFFCWTFFFLKISIVVGMISFALLSFIVYVDIQDNLQDILLKVCISFIVFSVVIASLSPIHLYSKAFPEYNHEANIRESLSKLENRENQKNRAQNKEYLKWKIQKQFFWIQLEINTKLFYQKNESKVFYRFGLNDTLPIIE